MQRDNVYFLILLNFIYLLSKRKGGCTKTKKFPKRETERKYRILFQYDVTKILYRKKSYGIEKKNHKPSFLYKIEEFSIYSFGFQVKIVCIGKINRSCKHNTYLYKKYFI